MTDAVSTIQNKPNLLQQLLPSDTSTQPNILHQLLKTEAPPDVQMGIFRQKQTEPDSLTTGRQHISPPGSVINSAPTRRVKTPPGFSGPPHGHKETSPLRQFTSHYESPQAYYESHTNPPSSPLSFSSSSSSSLGLGSATLRRGRDSPLGCLGSSGTTLTTPASPICRNHSRLFQ
jgi:hypothetical protein